MSGNNNNLITRDGRCDGMPSVAVYSKCQNYRYALTRTWNAEAKKILFVMLHSSTATENENDNTVSRCLNWVRDQEEQEYGSLRVCNLFAYRMLDNNQKPWNVESPVGPENDRIIAQSCDWADTIIAGWGNQGTYMGRSNQVSRLLTESGTDLFTLGCNQTGQPRHPLRAGNTPKQPCKSCRI